MQDYYYKGERLKFNLSSISWKQKEWGTFKVLNEDIVGNLSLPACLMQRKSNFLSSLPLFSRVHILGLLSSQQNWQIETLSSWWLRFQWMALRSLRKTVLSYKTIKRLLKHLHLKKRLRIYKIFNVKCSKMGRLDASVWKRPESRVYQTKGNVTSFWSDVCILPHFPVAQW